MEPGCEIFVEFHNPPSSSDIETIRDHMANRLFMFRTPAILLVQPQSEGTLGYSGFSVGEGNTLINDAHAGLAGSATTQRRLIQTGAVGCVAFSDWYWSKEWPKGPLPEYAMVMLTLLHEPSVKHCWYCQSEFSVSPPALSPSDVHRLIDDFVSIGARWPINDDPRDRAKKAP